ncbi:MAG: hypothetical protein ACK5PT_05215 [Cereibacter sp.]
MVFVLIDSGLAVGILASCVGRAGDQGLTIFPRAEDGLRSMAAVHGAVASAQGNGVWVDARPPMFR